MPRFLIKEQRIFLLKQWWLSGKSLHTVNVAFRDVFPNSEIPARQTIYRLVKKFEETGSVKDAPRSDRLTSVTAEENVQLVSQNFLLNPQTSQRYAARELEISRSTLQRIMKDLNLKPYKPRLLQALNEATFQTNDRVNRHNCVYWSDSNPHFILEHELNVPRVIVWGGIWSNGVVGPFFFRRECYIRELSTDVKE